MIKYIKALVLSAVLSFNAYAVDITLTISNGDATRFAVAVGKIQGLVDGSNNPRNATMAESKAAVAAMVKHYISDFEGAALNKAALDAVVVPVFDVK